MEEREREGERGTEEGGRDRARGRERGRERGRWEEGKEGGKRERARKRQRERQREGMEGKEGRKERGGKRERRTPLSLMAHPGSKVMPWFGRILVLRLALRAVTAFRTQRTVGPARGIIPRMIREARGRRARLAGASRSGVMDGLPLYAHAAPPPA